MNKIRVQVVQNSKESKMNYTQEQGYFFIGTAKEIEEKGIKLNGKYLDKVTISALSRHGLIETIGKQVREQKSKGRIAAVFGLKSRDGMVFSCLN